LLLFDWFTFLPEAVDQWFQNFAAALSNKNIKVPLKKSIPGIDFLRDNWGDFE
jgi:hypothetical protein